MIHCVTAEPRRVERRWRHEEPGGELRRRQTSGGDGSGVAALPGQRSARRPQRSVSRVVPHPPGRGARCVSRGREAEDLSLFLVRGRWGCVGPGRSAEPVHAAGSRLATARLAPGCGDGERTALEATGYERKYL